MTRNIDTIKKTGVNTGAPIVLAVPVPHVTSALLLRGRGGGQSPNEIRGTERYIGANRVI